MLNMHSLVLSWMINLAASIYRFFFFKKYIIPDKYIMEFLLYCYYYVTWCDAWSDLSHENYLMCSTTAVVVFIKWEYIVDQPFFHEKVTNLKNRSNRTLERLFLSRIWHHTCCQCNISSMLLSTIIHVL